MIETGTILQDRYLIEKQIGAGGMGAVYLAVDQRFGNHVALKETFYKDEEFGAAFEREAKLLNGLNHSALPHVSDYFTEAGEHFLVMQYIEGEDLSEILRREGAFPVETVVRWMDNLLDALEYLHSHEPPIIHRDIKPQNLKVSTRGDIVLLDFGLAKLKSEDSSAVQSVFGYSRKYSSLEQIQGVGTDARSDIFSLAATAYHLLTGASPIDVLARAAEIVVGNPDPLKPANEMDDKIPAGVANVLHKALALNSAARYDSAQLMREALRFVAGSAESAEKREKSAETMATAAIATQAVAPDDLENFPALEAFVAETTSDLPLANDNNELEFAKTAVTDNRTAPLAVSPDSDFIADVPTQVAPRVKKSRLPLAALAAVLLCAALTAGYFVSKASLSSEAESGESRIQSFPVPESKNDQAASVPAAPLPETADSSASESRETGGQEQNKAADSTEAPTIEKNESVAKSEPAEKPKTAQPKTETPRRTTEPKDRRTESERNGETRERVIENQPLPDIESIFTGRPSQQRNTGARRRQREQMTDEEIREMRRQRRQERRRQQQNRYPLPPF